MTQEQFDLLQDIAVEEFENNHDRFDTLEENEQDLYIAGFLDALEDFVDPEETPEEREAFLKSRYEGLSPEDRKIMEEIDKADAELWEEYVTETIARNRALHDFGIQVMFGS